MARRKLSNKEERPNILRRVSARAILSKKKVKGSKIYMSGASNVWGKLEEIDSTKKFFIFFVLE